MLAHQQALSSLSRPWCLTTYNVYQILQGFVQSSAVHLQLSNVDVGNLMWIEVASAIQAAKRAFLERQGTVQPILWQRPRTCRAKVAPLVLKLCSAKILSLGAIAGLPFDEDALEQLTTCLQLAKPADNDMQVLLSEIYH